MGDAGPAVWYALTLAIGGDGRPSRGDDWNPPLEMNGWLSQAAPGASMAGGRGTRVMTPAVDVRIDNEGISLVAGMPGIPRDRIEILVGPRYVEIVGKPPAGHGTDGEVLGRRPDQDPVRPPDAPAGASRGGAQAELRDGLLELRLPKTILLSGDPGGRVPVG